jgi:hypothetical protein
MVLSGLLKVTWSLCFLPQIIVVRYFTFDPNSFVFVHNSALFSRVVFIWGRLWTEWFAGTANNAGAILVLGRDLVVVPKLIHPLPPAITSPESSPERHLEDTWMQVHNFEASLDILLTVPCLFGNSLLLQCAPKIFDI